MTDQTSAEHKPKKQRSPNFPSTDLASAIEHVRNIYAVERDHPVPIQVVATKYWKFTPKSSAWMIRAAAIKAFGLTEDEGEGPGRKIKVSPLARKIIVDTRAESPDRDTAIREAALKPKIHAELWKKYGADLPSDENVAAFLTLEREFQPEGARALIKEYKTTIAFAKLAEADTIDPPEEDADDESGGEREEVVLFPGFTPPPKPRASGGGSKMRTFTLPLPSGEIATLAIPYPLSIDDYEEFKDAITTMKAGWTASKRQAQPGNAEAPKSASGGDEMS